ncbi:MAG: 50S ribosomal protein L9 [Candidatus Latescibacteria bacterium]|nr:50S ribosomal protein L9 [Candidatus Latescibacterota bacterium]
MKVILTETIDRLGAAGEMVTVSDGYGRNFLLPNRKAVLATPGNLKVLQGRLKQQEAKDVKEQHRAEALAKQLETISCTAVVQVGEEDRMFGSVTAQTVVDLLKEQGFEVDRRKVLLDEPIKALGIYTIPIRLHPQVDAQIKLWVVKE